MTLIKYLSLFGLISILFGCYKQERSQLQLSSYLADDYSIYRTQVNGVSTYYFDSTTLVQFLASYDASSNNVFDYNGNGTVDTVDFIETIGGYGNQYFPNYDLYSAIIDFQASSGWQIQLSPWPISFIKVTPWDEDPPGSYIPDILKSFVLEGINEDGQSVKIWYYRKY